MKNIWNGKPFHQAVTQKQDSTSIVDIYMEVMQQHLNTRQSRPQETRYLIRLAVILHYLNFGSIIASLKRLKNSATHNLFWVSCFWKPSGHRGRDPPTSRHRGPSNRTRSRRIRFVLIDRHGVFPLAIWRTSACLLIRETCVASKWRMSIFFRTRSIKMFLPSTVKTFRPS